MRVLLTGANGLLGQKLVPLFLKEHKHDLLATGRGPKRFGLDAQYAKLDVCDPVNVAAVFDEFKPEILINTAAMTNVDQCELNQEECHEVNVRSVEILSEACGLHNTFIVHLSTDFIFDGRHGPLTEDESASPVNYYGTTKLEAENVIKTSRLSWAIARTVLVYGVVHDMSRSNIILWVRDNLRQNKKIKLVNDQWRTPTLAEDLAMGCYLIAVKKAGGVFNISGKDFLTPYQMACYTAEYFGLDKNLIEEVDSTIFKQPAKRPMKTGFVIEKARKMLGYEPHSFKEGIEIIASQVEVINQ